ncbi:MAG: endonuclease V [Acidimicrobiia bacterium]|nr:endonuclease V [Acidimicrobiia bacterium]
MGFPTLAAELRQVQAQLAAERPPPFEPRHGVRRVAGVFVCFERGRGGPGAAGDIGWAGAAVLEMGRCIDAATVQGTAAAPYSPGFLALREGPLLAAAVRHLDQPFDVLLVNATGRDHPRRTGLALHLGALLNVPTGGVTHRALLADGGWPSELDRGARSPMTIDDELVGFWTRTRPHCRPLAIHAAWRTDADSAYRLVVAEARFARTPEPLREARRLARQARTAGAGSL